MLYRQGDVFIARIDRLPAGAEPVAGLTLAEGEVTGHSHRMESPVGNRLFGGAGKLYLRVGNAQSRVVHPEHGPVTLPRGDYRVWMQREYAPGALNNVRDVRD